MILPVILCGGSGTRLWPLSRKLYPKQFLSLYSSDSLLQQTAQRAAAVSGDSPLLVVTNEDQKFLVAEQLEGVPDLQVLIEPEAKNTAPAIALAALFAWDNYDAPVLLVMPSDHLITDIQAFAQVVDTAHRWARQGRLVTFGIRPAGAETGYGYIEQGASLEASNDVYAVKKFVEKPDHDTAERLVESGRHVWNSGIFMFDASVYLRELQALSPDIHAGCVRAMAGAKRDNGFLTAEADAFGGCPGISIDYAVMERTDKAVVVPYKGRWSDIGSWRSLADTMQHYRDEGGEGDGDSNVTVGEVYAHDVTNSYIHATNRLVAAVGVRDSIIVETGDAVLVTDKRSDQKIKDLVARLRHDNRQEVEHHVRVYRPWGSYQILDCGDCFQVKRLIIKPNASISLQLHHQRSEHWVVVKGEATVTKGEERFALQTNQSTYIPRETIHKLENHADCDLEIIEVQTGTYLGEDDIERFEDQYGRV